MNDRSWNLSRRRFLQGALATGSVAAIAPELLGAASEAAAAAEPASRVLVVVELFGGNDGLNTLVPYADGAYHDLRAPAGLAIAADRVLPVGEGLGLHPALGYLAQRFAAGDVAIVRGAAHPANDRSHFNAMEMQLDGWTQPRPSTTGWAGRYLDRFGTGPFRGIAVGPEPRSTLLTGDHHVALGLPAQGGLATSDRSWPPDALAIAALATMATSSSGTGAWGPSVASSIRSVISHAQELTPVYAATTPLDEDFAREMFTAARIVNLGVGAQVLHVRLGSFDTHTQQAAGQDLLLGRLDRGLRLFFETLAPDRRDRVVVATLSEFGRRVQPNGSGGTDHGGGSVQFVIGSPVRGGHYGEQPTVRDLDERGDLRTTVDSRAVVASILEGWLGTDAAAILGASYPTLPMFGATSAPTPQPDPEDAVRIQLPRPFRALDTRVGNGAPPTKRSRDVLLVQIAGRDVVPATGVAAVVANVTVTEPDGGGFLTAWPADGARPDTSVLNFAAGQTVPNLAILGVSTDGRIAIAVDGGPAHVLVDVLGWFPAGSSFVPSPPTRVLDSRRGLGRDGKVGPSDTVDLALAGAAGVPASGADAVVLNLTMVDSTATTYVTAWPRGERRPATSALNAIDGQPVANLLIQPLGAGGVSLRNEFGQTHLIADVTGWIPSGTGFHRAPPSRVLDTRVGLGAAGVLGHRAVVELDLAPALPPSARAAVVNVTVAEPSVGGYLSVYPAAVARPDTSNLNFAPGQVVANLVLCGLGADRRIAFFNALGTTHLIVDLVGWFD